MSGWIAVDFDGTLAVYNGWDGDNLGKPIAPMVDRVKKWLADGTNVKVFTARVGCSGLRSEVSLDNQEFADHQRKLITDWCIEHIGVPLEVTATKDFGMIELWDDRAVQVKMNTGEVVGHSTRGNS